MEAHTKLDADIFLCHSTVDKAFVRRLASDLRELKVSAWFDEWELGPGDSLVERIGAALETSVYVGVILSPASIKSRWCKRELNQALAREIRLGAKTILPIRVSDVKLPPFLEDKLYLDFSADYYRPLTQLSAMIHQLDVRSINIAVQERPPASIADIRLLFVSCDFDEEKLRTEDGAYRRLKKLNAMAPRLGSLNALGILCYQMQKDDEARVVFSRVLAADQSFSNFTELNERVRRLAKDGAAFELDTHTRTAMAYLGIINGDEDYVLNAAYGTTDREVLMQGCAVLYALRGLEVGSGIPASENV